MRQKIFVCVGTHTQPFDRLLKKVDEIAWQKKEEMEFFLQSGYCKYKPKNCKYKNFLDEKGFEKAISESSLIIGHGGAGLIISALSKKKKLIIIPRLEKFGEHTDSHQTDIAKTLAKKGKLLFAMDENGLLEQIEKSRNFSPLVENETKKIVKEIDEFVKKNG